MLNQKSIYEILEVTQEVTADEARKARNKLLLKHHPDKARGGDKEKANRKTQEINEAYETLLNLIEQRASRQQDGQTNTSTENSSKPSPTEQQDFHTGNAQKFRRSSAPPSYDSLEKLARKVNEFIDDYKFSPDFKVSNNAQNLATEIKKTIASCRKHLEYAGYTSPSWLEPPTDNLTMTQKATNSAKEDLKSEKEKLHKLPKLTRWETIAQKPKTGLQKFVSFFMTKSFKSKAKEKQETLTEQKQAVENAHQKYVVAAQNSSRALVEYGEQSKRADQLLENLLNKFDQTLESIIIKKEKAPETGQTSTMFKSAGDNVNDSTKAEAEEETPSSALVIRR